MSFGNDSLIRIVCQLILIAVLNKYLKRKPSGDNVLPEVNLPPETGLDVPATDQREEESYV